MYEIMYSTPFYYLYKDGVEIFKSERHDRVVAKRELEIMRDEVKREVWGDVEWKNYFK